MKGNATIAILGPGAIGGFLSALFEKAGFPVNCIGREKEVSVIRKQGITLQSSVYGTFTAHPNAEKTLSNSPDILFVTVKSPYLKESLASVPAPALAHAVVVPLLNGIGHVEVLRKHAGRRVAVGSIGAIEVIAKEGGALAHLSLQKPHIDLGSDHDVSKEKLDAVEDIISKTGIGVSLCSSEAEVIWRKLVRLNAIASTTAAALRPVGYVRSDPLWRAMLESSVQEGARVAEAEGVAIDPDEVMREIDNLSADLTTSLQRDVEKKARSELDAITGGVIARAKQFSIPCPVNQELYHRIQIVISRSL